MKKIIFYISALFLIGFILYSSQEIILYSKKAIVMCYELIIPSLFPFFVCSGLLVYSGFVSVLAKWAGGFMRPLFNISSVGAAAFVIGIISGFPLGSVTAADLYSANAISKTEAERLLAFCNNSGPLFIIGSVGAGLYGKPSFGIALYAIHISASILVGILFRFYHKNLHNAPPMLLKTEDCSIPKLISKSISTASKSILIVSFTIIFFSALSQALLAKLPLSHLVEAIASGICEFSTGTIKIAALDIGICEKLILTSFIIGFSGIAVHMQVMTMIAKSELSLKPYIMGKLLQGVIAAALTAVVLYFSGTVFVFSNQNELLFVSCMITPLFIAVSAIAVFIPMCIFKLKKSQPL